MCDGCQWDKYMLKCWIDRCISHAQFCPIQILESEKFLLVESGIHQTFAVKSLILGFEMWNTAHRIQNPPNNWNMDPSSTDKESKIQYLESSPRLS